MGDLSEPFRAKLVEVLETMRLKIADLLDKARDAGEISDTVDVQEVSNFIMSSWHGAVLSMKVEKSVLPLQIFEKTIFESLLG